MLSWIALACLIGAVALLTVLAVIDLRTRLLPNEVVAGFATLGFVFHLTTLASFVSVPEIFMGGFVGFGAMYLIRMAANRIYEQDALGLGDVKLIGAGGLWLGPEGIMLAMAVGAFAALLHGVFYGYHQKRIAGSGPDFAQLQIPAGPGFAAGLIAVGVIQFWNFRIML